MLTRRLLWIFILLFLFGINASGEKYTPPSVQITRYHWKVRVDFKEDQLFSECRMTVKNTGDMSVRDVPFLLYRMLTVDSAWVEPATPLHFNQNILSFTDWPVMQVNWVVVTLAEPLQSKEEITVTLKYHGYLKGYTETGMSYVRDRIDPVFTILRDDGNAYPQIGVPSWKINRRLGFPAFDYRLEIVVPETLVVANGGRFLERNRNGSEATWVYENMKTAWRVDVAIADYVQLKQNGVTIFAFRGDSATAADLHRTVAATRTLYQNWFGPIHEFKGFSIIEIPDGWGSQTDVSCIIQTASAFTNPARRFELYHELSHLWNSPETDDFPCRWQEGLAMFLQWLTVEKLEGRPVLMEKSEQELQRWRMKLKKNPDAGAVPFIDFGQEGVTGYSYQIGMLFFHSLYRLTGEDDFLALMKEYYHSHAQEGGTAEDFADYLKTNSTMKLNRFVDEWFLTTACFERIRSGMGFDEMVEFYR